ncbi:MAG: HAMP domain-containing sensor histidine kinase [Proteobacteria bacterium]|nr:HAMP domain-containing sensor histidine kinase [Pseudomonadota bacterium]
MAARNQTIFSILNRRITWTLVLLWGLTVIGVTQYAAFDLHRFQERTREMILGQITALSQAADQSQELFAVQRELTRFTNVLNKTQDYSVAVAVRINDQLIAESGDQKTAHSTFLHRSEIKSITLPSGGVLTVTIAVGFLKKVEMVGLALVIFTLALTFAALLLHLKLRKDVRTLTDKLNARVNWVSEIARHLPDAQHQIKHPPAVPLLELHELDGAITTLSQAIRRYDSELSASQKQLRDAEIDAAREAAISQMTRMLAHDIRHPFTALYMGLQAIEATDDVERIRKIAKAASLEVRAALASVENMVKDITEFGSQTTPVSERISIQTALEQSWQTVARGQIASSARLQCQFEHGLDALGDSVKIGRVFANIIENAVQAAVDVNVWFKTRDINGDGGIEICIGNDGPSIAPEDLPRIFNPTFSKGKRGGTGLGLAVAQKFVKEHGGTIRCTSSESGGTQFYLTLPAAPTLPTNSSRRTANLNIAHKNSGEVLL